ncbi:MAG: AIR synthase family protein [Desulfurococcaceae archaeon]
MKAGKPPWPVLSALISLLPSDDPDLVAGPSLGEDAGVARLGDGFLVVHSDPITTATRRIGWYAVHVAANDVAVRGARPRYFLPVVLLPQEGWSAEEIFRDMAAALGEVGGVAMGGHTEVTPGLPRPIVSMTSIGYTRGRVVMTRDARPGDVVIVSGWIGGEAASIVAQDFADRLREVDEGLIERAASLSRHISVVERALAVKDLVNSMHDATEGGLLQALREVALASNTRIVVDVRRVSLDPAVEAVLEAVGLDPLRSLSSGCLVATAPRESAEEAVERLEKQGAPVQVVGEVVDRPGKGELVLVNGERKEIVASDIVDEIYKLWS